MDTSEVICQHCYIENNECKNCGVCISISTTEYSDFNMMRLHKKPVKLPEFQRDFMNISECEIPADVREYVNLIASGKVIHRITNRKITLFAYIYLAYLHYNYTFEPEKIANILKLKKSQIGKALKLASATSRKILPQASKNTVIAPVVVIQPINYLNSSLEILSEQLNSNLNELYFTDLEIFFQKILKEHPMLLEGNPRITCLAIIKYYFSNVLKQHLPKFHMYFNATSCSVKKCIDQFQLKEEKIKVKRVRKII